MAVLRAKSASKALRKGKQDYGASSRVPAPTTTAAYTPPSDWLTYTEPLATEQKVIGTVAVWDADSNYVSFTMTITDATTYNVDWGDGTTSTNVASGTQVNHNYTYASLGAGTLTTRGYKQAIITITPTTAGKTFSNINLSAKPSTITTHNNPWLRLSISAPNATAIVIAQTTSGLQPTANAYLLESLNIVSHNLSNMSYLCGGLFTLQNITLSSTASVTSMVSMFSSCYYLTSVPLFNTVSVTDMSYMFANCFSLTSVPLFNTSKVTNMSYMFSNCYSLISVPLFNTARVSFINNMFANCYSLVSVPLFNTANVTNMSTMFSSCYSLTSVPLFNTASVTNMSQMFYSCSLLTSVPLFNTVSVTNMVGMFYYCYSLTSVPLFNTASVTSMSNMFYYCYSLPSVPLFNTANVTSMYSMFYNCYALTSVPLFNTVSVTNMGSMFGNCYSLPSVPLFNTASVTDMSSMFYGCYALTSVPLFNTASVTNMSSMFYFCTSLLSVPLFNTSKVLYINSFASYNYSLKQLPSLNLQSINAATNNTIISGTADTPNLSTIPLQNTRWSLNVANCSIGATELNAFYTGLATLNPTVTNVTSNGTTVTYTVSDITAFVAGRTVTITGVDPVAYNLTAATVASVITASNQFTVTNAATGAYVSGGVATLTDNATITVTGNPGVATDNPAIATAKGWTVTG